jgi:hypothetical protein
MLVIIPILIIPMIVIPVLIILILIIPIRVRVAGKNVIDVETTSRNSRRGGFR